MPAKSATKPEEPSLQNSTIQKRTEFPLHELRDWPVTLLLPGEESFEFFGDDAVQHAFFRMARSVFKRGGQHALPGGQELIQLK